jgi:hypothetical protein
VVRRTVVFFLLEYAVFRVAEAFGVVVAAALGMEFVTAVRGAAADFCRCAGTGELLRALGAGVAGEGDAINRRRESVIISRPPATRRFIAIAR